MVPKSLSNSSIGPKTINRGTGHDEQIIANNVLIGKNIDIYQFCEYVQVTYIKMKSRVPFNIGGERRILFLY